MGPDKRLVPISFAGGIDTKTDPKQVLPGKMLDLENVVFQQTGALSRRWGYAALGQAIIGSGSLISACAAVNAFNNELVLYDGQQAYSYIPSENAWASRGPIVSIIQTNSQVIRNSSQQLSCDIGYLGGFEVYAWEDSRGGIRYSVVDTASSALIVSDQPLYVGAPSTLVRPKVIAYAAIAAIAIFYVQSDGSIGYVTITTANPAAPTTPTILLAGLGTSALGSGVFYDVNPTSYNIAGIFQATGGVIAWTWTTGSPYASQSTNFFPLTASGGAINLALSVNTVAAVQVGAVACSPCVLIDSTRVNGSWVATSLGPGGGGNATVTSSFGTVNAFNVGTPVSICGVVNADQSTTWYCEVVGTNGNIIYTNTVSSAGVLKFPAATPSVFLRGVGLVSKAFTYAGRIYLNVAFASQQQNTYFTVNDAGVVVAKANAQLGGGYVSSSDYVLSEVPAIATGIFKYANLVKGIVNTEAGVVQSLLGVNTTKLDFIDSNHFLSDAINGAFYTVGGILNVYDGAQYVEHGFHVYPESPTNFGATPSTSGGSMAAGTYFYAITYEWVDNTGATQFSTPSTAFSVTVTGAGSGSVAFTIPTLRLTRKSRVRIVIYRTAASGIILYRVTSALLPTYSDPTVDTISFTDTLNDTSITGNGTMYTQPLTVGANPVLPNAAPPSSSLCATYDDRLFLAGLDDPYLLWYSKQSSTGIPMEFSASLTLRADPDGGGITGIYRMDDKLIVFKRSAIFYLSGTGPTATGDNSQFGSLISVPSGGVGCVNANTIVLTPIGLLFQSANGIYLIDRGLNVSYKGAPVQAFNSLPFTSADLIPNQWVVFTSSSGIALVYDYYYDQWSTFTNHAAIDADIYLGGGNTFVWANAAGQVFQQTVSVFSDNGQPIPFSATTAWINPGTIQGYQRVYHAFLLGTYKGVHTLNVFAGFDYDDAFTTMTLIASDPTLNISTFGSASPFGIDSPFGGSPGQSVYQFRLDILRKCQAIRFQITDTQSTPGNEGFSLSALTLLLGVKRGGFKLPAGKQFGLS